MTELLLLIALVYIAIDVSWKIIESFQKRQEKKSHYSINTAGELETPSPEVEAPVQEDQLIDQVRVYGTSVKDHDVYSKKYSFEQLREMLYRPDCLRYSFTATYDDKYYGQNIHTLSLPIEFFYAVTTWAGRINAIPYEGLKTILLDNEISLSLIQNGNAYNVASDKATIDFFNQSSDGKAEELRQMKEDMLEKELEMYRNNHEIIVRGIQDIELAKTYEKDDDAKFEDIYREFVTEADKNIDVIEKKIEKLQDAHLFMTYVNKNKEIANDAVSRRIGYIDKNGVVQPVDVSAGMFHNFYEMFKSLNTEFPTEEQFFEWHRGYVKTKNNKLGKFNDLNDL